MTTKIRATGLMATSAILLLTGMISYGQDMKWPEDRMKAEEKIALYTDALSQERYRDGAIHLTWLLEHSPDIHLSIYQNGAKIYENLAELEEDNAKKLVLLDSMLWMYDERIRYFGDEANVLNRKAFKAYRYLVNYPERLEFLLDLFKETIEKSKKDEILTSNLPAYMNVVKIGKLRNKITVEEVFERYEVISALLDHKASKGEDVQNMKDLVDKLLTDAIPEGIDCDFVIKNLGPKFKEQPQDMVLSKRIFAFMLNGKCTEKPLFLDVAKAIQKQEPAFGLGYKVIAKKCILNEDFACAEKYMRDALKLTTSNKDKAEVHVDLGKIRGTQGRHIAARDEYRLAIELDPGNKDAYNGIGNLYFYGASECAQMKYQAEDRFPYLAAYRMYEKAGNEQMMEAAKEQFPSKEEIFEVDLTKGEVITVGCWINETVTLLTRD